MRGLLLTPQRPGRPPMKVPILRWQVALLVVVLIHLVSGLLLTRLRIDNAPDVYYTPGSPAVVIRDKLRAVFPTDELLIVAFVGDDLYQPATLRRLHDFGLRLQKHPLIDRVSSITSIERISATADGFAVGPLVDVDALDKQTPQKIFRAVMADRFAPGSLASKDGKLLAVVVQPKQLTDSSQRQLVRDVMLAEVDRAGLRQHFAGDAGPITMDVAQLQSVIDDTVRFVPITMLLAMGLMWWVVGRWRPMVIGAVAMSTVILPSLALIAVWGRPYTMVSAMLPSLLAAYTSATLIHLYAVIQRGHAARLSRGRSLDEALANSLKPGMFNVLTTSAGLLSLAFVPMPPIQVFGIVGAFGTALVFAVIYFLVPPFLRHWDSHRWPIRGSGLGKFGRIAPRMAIFSMRHARLVIICFSLLALVSLPLVLKVQAESDILAFFKPGHPVSKSTRLIENRLSGVTTLEIYLQGSGPDSMVNLDKMRAVRDLQTWLRALPEVDRSLSYVDMIEEMHFAMNDENPAFRVLPPSRKLLQQYLLVYDGRDLYDLVDRSMTQGRILLSLNVHGAQALGAVVERVQQRLKDQPLPELQAEVGGYGRLFSDQSAMLLDGQAMSFATAFGQIFVFMWVLWRSVSAAAICITPNLAPLFFVFVVMGALGIHLDTATVLIASIVLGITVDDTIHLFHGWRHRREQGLSATWAVARTFKSSGSAVMAISVLLVSQFLLLATSEFLPTANFGLMTAVGLLAGQAFELLLTPALLLAWARWGSPGSRLHRQFGEPTMLMKDWDRPSTPEPNANANANANANGEGDSSKPRHAPPHPLDRPP